VHAGVLGAAVLLPLPVSVSVDQSVPVLGYVAAKNANPERLEGNSGTTPFVFTVTLSAASASTVTVNYATADGTATAGSDYLATSGTLTFNPGVTTQPITVSVIGDTTVEPNETFFVNLSSPSNATIATGQGTGTIVNDDGAVASPPTDIPTLSQVSLLVLAAALAWLAGYRIRRRRPR